jgi:hypothetical protein
MKTRNYYGKTWGEVTAVLRDYMTPALGVSRAQFFMTVVRAEQAGFYSTSD